MGCPMRIKIVAVSALEPSGPWRITYTADGSCKHNHPPSFDVRVHVAHRQRDAKHIASTHLTSASLIEVQTAAGVPTSQIYATLLATDDITMVTPQDITNVKSAARTKLLGSSTSIEVFLKILDEKKFYSCYEIDPSTNRIKYLLWAHPETTKLAQHFMDVVVLDCTYKTNNYRMPLFNAIVLTGMNAILPFAQIWLPGEGEPDYTWAMSKLNNFMDINSIRKPRVMLTDRDLACTNASDTIFPLTAKLLCRWHIDRNVLAQAQKKIGQVDVSNAVYRDTIESETEEEFEIRKEGLNMLSSKMGKYLAKEWWPYKHKIVKCWTSRYRHFGNHSTSTVEGTHTTMKRWLDNSRGDLFKVFIDLLPWWIGAASRNSLTVARNIENIPALLREDDCFSACIRIITVWALVETNKLWVQAHKTVVHGVERSRCDGTFRRIHGRPCLHELMTIIESDDQLKLIPQHLDRHWWLPTPESITDVPNRILEPARLQNNRYKSAVPRPHRSGYGFSSTRREPSSFELVVQFPTPSNNPAPRLPSFSELFNEENEVEFTQAFLPPRSWGYAGMRDLGE